MKNSLETFIIDTRLTNTAQSLINCPWTTDWHDWLDKIVFGKLFNVKMKKFQSNVKCFLILTLKCVQSQPSEVLPSTAFLGKYWFLSIKSKASNKYMHCVPIAPHNLTYSQYLAIYSLGQRKNQRKLHEIWTFCFKIN